MVQPPYQISVTRLVDETWRQHLIGHGRDARNLAHQGIKVRRVFQIENVMLYKKYVQHRNELILRHRQSAIPGVRGLAGEGEIDTLKVGKDD